MFFVSDENHWGFFTSISKISANSKDKNIEIQTVFREKKNIRLSGIQSRTCTSLEFSLSQICEVEVAFTVGPKFPVFIKFRSFQKMCSRNVWTRLMIPFFHIPLRHLFTNNNLSVVPKISMFLVILERKFPENLWKTGNRGICFPENSQISEVSGFCLMIFCWNHGEPVCGFVRK